MTGRAARDIVGRDGPIRVDEDGVLWIEGRAAPDLAEEFGTPLYVTSEAQIRANVRRMREAFESRWPRVTLLYATKSNANLAVRRVLVEEGVGGDCFGLGELTVSLRGGVTPELLVMNGSNKQPPELRAAIEAGVTINIDDPSELDLVAGLAEQLGRPADVCLRVLPFSYADPATLEPELARIAADTSHDKWGMDRQTIVEILPNALESRWLRLRGLHLHVSRLLPTPEAFELAAALITTCLAELNERYGWQPEVLDFGGGFPHERDPESGSRSGSHAVGTPEQYAEAITSRLHTSLADHSLREPHLLLEPGRRLVSNATVLLTRVGVVKRLPTGSTTWVNVDASTNHCPRVPLQGYYYEIVHATKGLEPGDADVSVVGPTCVVDLLGERRLPSPRQGDLLAVLDVGGYAEVLSSQFNLRAAPGDGARQRRRLRRDPETRDDRRPPRDAGGPGPPCVKIVDNVRMIDNLARRGIAPGRPRLKITDVEAVVLRQPIVNEGIADGSQDDLVVLIHTDEGITGIGEVDSAPEAVAALVSAPGSHAIAHSLRQLLIGEDPLDVERLWDKMYRGVLFVGRRGIAIHAISGIDIALWDVKGKALGKPVCELLGTVQRDRVRAYASRLMPDTTEEVTEAVSALREQGFTAVKLGWGPLGQDPDHDVRLAAAAREAGGDHVEIMIDAGLGYVADAGTAIRVARELEELGVYWLEEPFEPDEYEAYAELADAVDLTIAAGEQDATRWGFRELIERGHVDLIQPDVTRCGGITELLRIAALAEEYGVAVVPHAWKSGIIKAASLHVNAVLPEALFQEYCVAETEINTKLTHQLLPIEADGCVAVPTAPGLGVEVDEDVFSSLRVEAR